jgi:hypothetical protein
MSITPKYESEIVTSLHDFKLGGDALKKIAMSRGRCKHFWCVKNHDFTPKNHIFSNGGGRHEKIWGGCPPWIRPYSLLQPINSTSGHLWHFDDIWLQENKIRVK